MMILFTFDFNRSVFFLLLFKMTTIDSKVPAHASNVYLFKNGYGMIVKTFEFPPSADQSLAALELIDTPAHAVHGTFWIQSRTDQSNL